MRLKGKEIFCGRQAVLEATMVYGEFKLLKGKVTDEPRPKKLPSPGKHSWSLLRLVWLAPVITKKIGC